MNEIPKPEPKSAEDCLKDLIRISVNTSALAHKWGAKNRCQHAEQALRIMTLVENILTESHKIIHNKR